MKKLLTLLTILLIGCSGSSPEPTTAWEKADYKQIDGIVEIATAWGKSHLCTGSLIRENVVLTAAHCTVFPAEDLMIVYGCNDIDNKECKRVPVQRIEQYYTWEKQFVFADDIAVLITETPITGIGLAQISDRKDLEEGLSVRAVGFGRRNQGSGVLYEGIGRITEDFQRELVVKMRGKLDPNPGDSGGPLLIMDNGKWKIVGLLSRARWESVSNPNSNPTSSSREAVFEQTGYAIYTKPIPYLDWINKVK